MLELNTETVQFIIDRAHDFQIQHDAAFEEQELDVETALDDEYVHSTDDPIYLELKATIEDLEPDQQVALVALMWLGRGDYTIDEWDRAVERAGDSWNERSADYLIRTPLLADYLSEGLDQFGDSSGGADSSDT